MELMDMPLDEFMGYLPELEQMGYDRDELIRMYRAQNSPMAPVNAAADASAQEITNAGRRPVAGGLFSKPVGATGWDAIMGLDFEGWNGLTQAGAGIGQAVDAPMAAAQGLIPQGDMALEALGTAGAAMTGGGAATTPRGSLRAGFSRSAKDASDIFGEGTQRVIYRDPESGGMIEVLQRPNGNASVLELRVPEEFRGRGIGQSLQGAAMAENPRLMGQVSSKAAATTAYRLGRRPYGQPDASLDDVFRMIDEDSSVNMLTPDAQPSTLAANADTSGGLLATTASDALTPSQQMARRILDMRAAGRARDVTDEMMAAADPQYMYNNTPLPMDEASRMARAGEMFPDTAYHSTGVDFQEFVPSEFRGASFFGSTPEGASRGASASANEGIGSGSSIIMPVRVDTRNVEGLGAYGRRDQNEFAASLPNRIYSEAEVDALMASDAAPLYGDWSYFFDDLTDYDALRNFRDANPSAGIQDGIIKYRPKQPLPYAPGLRSDISGRQFAHYSEGMSERPISQHTKEIGNTGFTMMDESGLALAMTDPTKVRSRFARFDPEFAHLSNLNAANIDPLTGLFGAMAAEEQRRRRNAP